MRRMDDFERAVEKLRGVDVEEYHLESEEAVAAAAVKAYLIDFTWQEAREQLRSVMKNTVLKIPPLHAKPELLKATIKGEKLAVLIDTAVREKTADMKEQRNVIEEGEAYDLWTIAIKALESLSGADIVENVPPEFLCFITDCYKELRD